MKLSQPKENQIKDYIQHSLNHTNLELEARIVPSFYSSITREHFTNVIKRLKGLGFDIIATSGTHDFLSKRGTPSIEVKKILEGRPNILDYLISNKVQMIINTIENQSTYKDSMILRRNAINQKIPYFTTLRAAKAAINSIDQLINFKLGVKPIQRIIKFK